MNKRKFGPWWLLLFFWAELCFMELVVHAATAPQFWQPELVLLMLYPLVPAVLLFALCRLFPPRANRVLGPVCSGLCYIFFASQLVYYSIFHCFYSAYSMGNGGQVMQFWKVTLHAIRKGIVVAEIQQNSNVTYRIYDYGRLGADGEPRQLHIPQALDVTLREPPKAQDFHGHLAQCDYFTVDAVEDGFEDVCDETSFTSLLVLEGKGTLTETATGESLPIRKGQSLFLPAGTGAYAVTGTDLKCLRTRV